jgi:uncharacterized repeat protein (TIGR02543 family)
VRGNAQLDDISCSGNRLTVLDVSNMTALTKLDCGRNDITTLNLSGCSLLLNLGCENNALTALDVSDCTTMTALYCSGNKLTALDVSKNPALFDLYCVHNRIPDSEARRALIERFHEGSVLPQDVNVFVVTFDSQNGRASSKQSYLEGTSLSLPSIPTRSGYGFQGWFTAPSGGTRVGGQTKITSNVTFYAQWKAIAQTVLLHANGGKVADRASASVSRDYGSALGALPVPTRVGHAFLGWYTAKTDGMRVAAEMVVKADATYWAHWKANTYTVKFSANGGRLAKTALTSFKRSHASKLGKLPTPKRTGYKFLGWYTGKVRGERVAATTRATKSITLYAHWKVNTYTVKFSANGGKVSRVDKFGKAGKASVSSVKRSHASKLGKLPTPKRTGYKFLGWYTAKAASKGKKVSATTRATKNVTLYAHWKKVR